MSCGHLAAVMGLIDVQFTAIFSQELHRAGFCCNGHVHRAICRERTTRVSIPQNRSVQGMEKPLAYELPRRNSVTPSRACPRAAERPHDRSRSRSCEQALTYNGWIQKYLISGTARHLPQAIDQSCASRLLRAEVTRLRYGLSDQQIAAILSLSGSMFGSDGRTPMPQRASTSMASDVKDWEDTVMLFNEHRALRETIMCRERKKRDSETKVEVMRRHAGVKALVRENYLKSMRRLDTFRDRTALPFPPNGDIFLHWYSHPGSFFVWKCNR